MSDHQQMTDRQSSGFHAGTHLEEARQALGELVIPHDRTEIRSLSNADGCVLASPVTARRNSPHYARAALDGFAIRARDTENASEEAPVHLDLTTGSVSAGEAVRVHTGSEVPDGADAVVRIERTTDIDGTIEITQPVSEDTNIAPIGEDLTEGQHLYDAGHRLRPSDVGLLKSAGVREVTVYDRPRISVIPTGEEVVDADPEPGETIETNGLTVSRLVDRWGANPKYRDIVGDEKTNLQEAILNERDTDLIVTIGGCSVGKRDLVPEAVETVGELLVHGLSIKPGHPAGIGVVDDTPILLLPGYPVSCIINAVQLLRPAISWLVGTQPKPLPTVRATLVDPIESSSGIRRFARVRLRPADSASDTAIESNGTLWTNPRHARSQSEVGHPSTDLMAVPTTPSGAGVLSSVALADGWVEVPEDKGSLQSGSTVHVQDWEWHP